MIIVMERRRKLLTVVIFLFFCISLHAAAIRAEGDGNGNDNKGNNGNNGNDKGKKGGQDNGKKDKDNKNGKGQGGGDKKPHDDDSNQYKPMPPKDKTGQEQFQCLSKGPCYNKVLTCPPQCTVRKPKQNKKKKGCYVDCSRKCEATCKWRKPKCNGYGALCYDPRFIGGDGVMFYFHGSKGGDFAIISDDNLHINAHFIGTRPEGRTRDFTWVQALSIMFETHTLVLAATRVSHWNDNIDALIVRWNGETIRIPTDGEAEWKIGTEERVVVVERTDDITTVRVTVTGLVEIDVKVTPIGEEENRIHNYQLPKDDAFAHLETQFRFSNLSDAVEGILGKTYRPDYISPVKVGVPMPMMGGEDKYQTQSFYSHLCKACRFQRPPGFAAQ